MDDTTDLLEAVYIALEELEALNPAVVNEPWFQLIERGADGGCIAQRVPAD